MTHLRQAMLEELHRRNYAASTIAYYVRHVEEFARFFKRAPDRSNTSPRDRSRSVGCSREFLMTRRKRPQRSTAVWLARPARSPEVCVPRRAGASARVIRGAADRMPRWPTAPECDRPHLGTCVRSHTRGPAGFKYT